MADMFARLVGVVFDSVTAQISGWGPLGPQDSVSAREIRIYDGEHDIDMVPIVRALLAELRKPTEAVLIYGRDTLASRSPEYDVPYDITDKVFTDMIDAILAEAGGSGG